MNKKLIYLVLLPLSFLVLSFLLNVFVMTYFGAGGVLNNLARDNKIVNALVNNFYTVSQAILLIFWVRKIRVNFRELGLSKISFKKVVVWSILTVALSLLVSLLDYVVGDVSINQKPLAYFVFQLFLIIIPAAFIEEIIVRGLMWKFFSGFMGPLAVLLFQAIYFSFLHIQIQPNIYGILSIFLTGIIWGYARWKSGNIYPSLLAHIVFNFINTYFLVSFF